MSNDQQYSELAKQIRSWADELGFQQLGISGIDLGEHPAYLERWLAAGYHGEMDYMARHGSRRSRPAELIPGTLSILSLRMDYLTGGVDPVTILDNPGKAYISRYTLGRDYHKLIRKRLAQLARRIEAEAGRTGLDRQEHHADQLPGWLLVFPWRDLHRPAPAAGPTHGRKALWEL